MDFSEYTRTLIKCIGCNWIIFAVLTPLFLWPEISYIRKRTFKKGERTKAEKDANIGMLGLLLVFALTSYNTIPAAIDAIEENYVSVHGEYWTSKGKYRISVYVITDDGEQVDLRVPDGSGLIKNDVIHLGEDIGTVWYAEKSGYILDFIPDEDSE